MAESEFLQAAMIKANRRYLEAVASFERTRSHRARVKLQQANINWLAASNAFERTAD